MGKRIVTWSLLTCCALASVAPALTADDYVIAGRTRLFEGTAAGLIEAYDIFEAGRNDTGCPDCPGDRELVLLHAIAKTAMLFIDHNDVLVGDGLFRLAEEFGIPLLAIVPHDGQRSFVDKGRGARLWVSRADREMTRDVLQESILPELEDIISQLDSIGDSPGPFVVYLVPEETGLAGDLEIDYGDVLIFKGLLLAYKGWLAAEMALDLDTGPAGGDIAPEAIDRRPYDEPQDRVWESPSLLAVLSMIEEAEAGHESLGQARADCIDALTCYLDAIASIAAEDDPTGSDPQEDELVYIDPEAQSHLNIYRETLATLRNRLAEGGNTAYASETVRNYEVYDADSVRLGELSLVFDCTGTEGQGGRLVLSDGTALEVDWFCIFEEGDIGVSLYDQGQKLEGWLEGAIDTGQGAIRHGTLEAWGTGPGLLTEAVGQMAAEGVRATRSDTPAQFDTSLSEEISQMPVLSHAALDSWRKAWWERIEVLTTISHLWFTEAERMDALPRH